ncbi:hypothetical protein OSC27_01290 [Microbacterium sp. STN6]|uniref:hypothetical protein n=1 Tax=Microbacterium sp. STN6 TaxID=2995588 RepID=UPI002260DA1E|nr:hypothetical protein [Microbacterium sp. STN6]MCX7520905.1 hypothetical protein [Microbacterium sp. STN6]
MTTLEGIPVSSDQITSAASTRFRRKRSVTFVAASIVAAVVSLGGPLTAEAASSPTGGVNATATPSGTLEATGSGFVPYEGVSLTYDTEPAVTGFSADKSGWIDIAVNVPDDETVGPHTITFTGVTSDTPVVLHFDVVAMPTITLSTTNLTASEVASTGVTATVSGFTPGQSVAFLIGNGGVDSYDGDVVAKADGTAAYTYAVKAGGPLSTGQIGTYSVRATSGDMSMLSQSASFTVVADPTAAAPAVPAVPAAPAAPATPVAGNASFTG